MRSAKAYREHLREHGVFYTQKALAEKMRSFLPSRVDEIYDPACGEGGLLSVFPEETLKWGQDVDEEAVRYARENIPNFTGAAGDTLTCPAFTDRRFKAIMANPPFSLKWAPVKDPRWDGPGVLAPKSKADWAFILHCLHMLDEDGTAVVLESTGVLFRGQSEGKIRKWAVEQNYVDAVEAIEPGQFEDTDIPTVIIVLKKHRDTTDITFRSGGEEKVAGLDEVKKNGYDLSVNRYIVPPMPEKEPGEPADLRTLNAEVRESAIASLTGTLDIEKALYGVHEDPDILKDFLKDIRAALDEWEARNIGQWKNTEG